MRFRFTSAGKSFAPESVHLDRDEARLSDGEMRAARRSPKALSFNGKMVGSAANTQAQNIAIYTDFIENMNAVFGTGGSVMIDDLFLDRYCFAYLTSAPISNGSLIQPFTLNFSVPDGVWRRRSDTEPIVQGGNILGNGLRSHITIDNESSGRDMKIHMLGATAGTVANPTITRLSHNLIEDSGFQAYKQQTGAFTPVERIWRGLGAAAPWASRTDDGKSSAIIIDSSGTSTKQRVLCLPSEMYHFSAYIRSPSGGNIGTAGSCILRLKYLNESNTTLSTFSTTATASDDDWERLGVSGMSPATTVKAQLEIALSGAGAYLVCDPQLSESSAAVEYINTSIDEYKPSILSLTATIPTSTDIGGVFFIDTEKRMALRRGFTGLSNQVDWFPATGLVSGAWLPLLPGTNHLRFSEPSDDAGQWPVKATINKTDAI